MGQHQGLQPSETKLTGRWLVEDAKVGPDPVCERVQHLRSEVLERIAVSPEFGAWQTLYRDRADGRLWECTYPQGELHGGGPPQLAVIHPEEAAARYGNLDPGPVRPAS